MRVFACMASSLDGKIGPAGVDRFVSISSSEDQRHLKALRDEADGILFGASTLRAWPKVHVGLNKPEVAHHFIMSRSLDLDLNTPLFQDDRVPITLFTPTIVDLRDKKLPRKVDVVEIPEDAKQIASILDYVKKCGVTSLLIEGGGRILNRFISAQVLHELYLTVVPSFMGQADAPQLLGGLELSNKPLLHLQSSRQIVSETFLHYRLDYSQ